MEPFVVKHYSADERPTIKGNGFDGLEIGEAREEAQAFIDCVNRLIAQRDELLTAARDVLSHKRGEDDWLILSVHCRTLEEVVARCTTQPPARWAYEMSDAMLKARK